MASITKAHHMGLQVADLDRSVAFYRNTLGFDVIFAWNPQAAYIRELVGYPEADIHAAVLRLPGTEVVLELLDYRNVQRTPIDPATANPGTAHIAFFVDDLDSLYADLVASGVRSVSPPVTPTIGPNEGGRAVYLIDPDGIRELIETRRTFAEYAAEQASRHLHDDRPGDGALASRPLAGLRVIDAGVLFAGPVIGTLLADFGADVIKVEHPRGDALRTLGWKKEDVSLWWAFVSRNKRLVSIDFSKPEGAQVLRELVTGADVLIESYRPGTMGAGNRPRRPPRAQPQAGHRSDVRFRADRAVLAPSGIRHRSGVDERLRPHQRPAGRPTHFLRSRSVTGSPRSSAHSPRCLRSITAISTRRPVK